MDTFRGLRLVVVKVESHDDYVTDDVVRPIQTFPKDKDGMFIQPEVLTTKLALQVEHNRQRMTKKWDYADEFCGDTKTLDVNGDYNCGTCNQADGKTCLAVYDDDGDEEYKPLAINLKFGSCGKYEIIDAGDPELRCNRLPASVANYGVRKGGSAGHVFGCHECWKAKPTKWGISNDRIYWCGEGATTVQKNSCCTLNGAPVVGDDS
jgi:hypothetical protein